MFLLAACKTTNVSYQAAQLWLGQEKKSISGFIARPKGKGPFPAVVLLHTCGGLAPHVTEDWPNYLSQLGYVVLTVDSLGSRGGGNCNSETYVPAYMEADAYGALDYLATLPSVDKHRIGVVGFSYGGIQINKFVMDANRREGESNFKAGISVYGRCHESQTEYQGKLQFPLLNIIGEKDGETAPCKKLKPPFELAILPGAYHAFDKPENDGKYDPAGFLMVYDYEATKKARQLTKAYLAKHLGK